MGRGNPRSGEIGGEGRDGSPLGGGNENRRRIHEIERVSHGLWRWKEEIAHGRNYCSSSRERAPPLNRDSGVSKLGTPVASPAPPHIVATPPIEVPPSSVFALGEPHLPAFSEVVVLGGGHLWSWTSAADLPFLWLSIPAAVMLKDAWPPPAAAPVAGSPLPLLPQFSGGSSFGFYALLPPSCIPLEPDKRGMIRLIFGFLSWLFKQLPCCCLAVFSAAAVPAVLAAALASRFSFAPALRAFVFVGPPWGHFRWWFVLHFCRFAVVVPFILLPGFADFWPPAVTCCCPFVWCT